MTVTELPAPPAPTAAPALVFEETEIPARERTAAPNPFQEAVQSLVGREPGKQAAMTVTLPTVDEK